MRIILASSSPRRQELMKLLSLKFEVIPSNIEEKLDSNNNHYKECMKTSKAKASEVFNKIKDDVMVIGSDTIVSFNHKIYGKPKNYNEAYQMIKDFSGNKHEVISSLCVLVRKDGKVYEELTYDKCDVYCSSLTSDEIDDWVKNNDVYSKAGAYAIQEGFGKYISKIDGDYYSIVGFPLHKFYEILKKYN